jgi:hypothetical protein
MSQTTTNHMQEQRPVADEESPSSAGTRREDALDADDVFGDAVASDHLLHGQLHPLQAAIGAAEKLADPRLVYDALACGDRDSIESLKRELKMLPATGIGPAGRSKLGELASALAAGLGGISQGTGDAEKARVDLGRLSSTVAGAFSAARVIQEDIVDAPDSFELRFQSISSEDAEEAQDDLSNLEEADITPSHAELLQRPDVQEVEIVEEVVDFYTAYTHPKYEIIGSSKLKEEEGG